MPFKHHSRDVSNCAHKLLIVTTGCIEKREDFIPESSFPCWGVYISFKFVFSTYDEVLFRKYPVRKSETTFTK